jgi:hypothetical protein
LFVIDNTDMNWLGNESSFTDSVAAAELWQGLGVQGTMGASQVGGHAHCNGVPQAQLDELGRFVDKFLIGTARATPTCCAAIAFNQIAPLDYLEHARTAVDSRTSARAKELGGDRTGPRLRCTAPVGTSPASRSDDPCDPCGRGREAAGPLACQRRSLSAARV